MNMVKITISVGGKPVELTIEEARAVRDQLDALFGMPTHVYQPICPSAPIGSPVPPWTVTCGIAQESAK